MTTTGNSWIGKITQYVFFACLSGQTNPDWNELRPTRTPQMYKTIVVDT